MADPAAMPVSVFTYAQLRLVTAQTGGTRCGGLPPERLLNPMGIQRHRTHGGLGKHAKISAPKLSPKDFFYAHFILLYCCPLARRQNAGPWWQLLRPQLRLLADVLPAPGVTSSLAIWPLSRATGWDSIRDAAGNTATWCTFVTFTSLSAC